MPQKTAPPGRPHNIPVGSIIRATDYVHCTAATLSATLDKLNRDKCPVVAVTQWRDVYTIFFRSLVAYG